MNDEHDSDLRAVFARQRGEDHENAPAWRPEWLNRPVDRPRVSVRWVPASFAAVCVVVLTVFLPRYSPQPAELSDLPPLFDSPPAELFASVTPPLFAFESPSDFLLPSHLNP